MPELMLFLLVWGWKYFLSDLDFLNKTVKEEEGMVKKHFLTRPNYDAEQIKTFFQKTVKQSM